MKVNKVIVIASLLLGACLGDPSYFSCYKDKCVRGLQHCVHEANEWRCFHCRDMEELCGTENMPRDCDSYCIRKELQSVQDLFDMTRNKLEESVQRLNTSLSDASLQIEALQEEKTQLVSERNQIQTDLNTSNEKYLDLKQNYTDLQQALIQMEADFKKERHSENKTLFVAVLVMSSVIVVLIVVIVTLCFKDRIKRLFQRDNKPGNNKHKMKPDIECEETKLMMEKPSDEKTENISWSSSKDSAVNLTGDQYLSDSKRNSDNINTEVVRQTVVDKSLVSSHVTAESELTASEDNCLTKHTSEVLKGIAPTTTSSSQTNLNQNVYS